MVVAVVVVVVVKSVKNNNNDRTNANIDNCHIIDLEASRDC